jgi:hypothetical protein
MSKHPATVATVPVPERSTGVRKRKPPPQPAAGDSAESPDVLDWQRALEVASARLIESSIEHDTPAHMEASGMAEEFAAQLCAYGLVEEELNHMHKREDARENGEPFEPHVAA